MFIFAFDSRFNMIYRSGNPGDFQHVETFVWQAIFPAFDHPDLNDAQRASNDAIIETARRDCYEAMGNPKKKIFVAWDERRKELAGFVIVDRSPYDYPELASLIVSRRNWGKGVAPELMKLGLDWLGNDKPIKLGVIHYNERAIAFFQKYGFTDTGETAGDYLIPRVLMLREASSVVEGDPYFTATPDAAIDLWNTDELESEELLDELFAEPQVDDLVAPPEKKLERKPPLDLVESATISAFETSSEISGEDDFVEFEFFPQEEVEEEEEELNQEVELNPQRGVLAEPDTKSSKYDIEFEVDYGARSTNYLAPDEPRLDSSMTLDELAIAFAEREEVAEEEEATSDANETKRCSSCGVSLPVPARFCIECGAAQQHIPPASTGPQRVYLDDEAAEIEEEITLELPELELVEEAEAIPENTAETAHFEHERVDKTTESEFDEELYDEAEDYDLFEWEEPLLRQFREQFKLDYAGFVHRFFGKRKVGVFVEELAQSDFQRVIDNALEGIHRWAQGREMSIAVNQVIATLKYQRIAGDLIEYFIVEEAKELHRIAFPQRLLRYQSAEWAKIDLFRLTHDYLDFASESETVYTDFITLPTRKLKNATQSFLFAGRDERIFFIVDLSLTGSLNSGFAFTDSGIYWKNVLQPNHAAFFNEIKSLEMKSDHLLINGHFFDAGKQLNFKVAMLLAKLSRIMP